MQKMTEKAIPEKINENVEEAVDYSLNVLINQIIIDRSNAKDQSSDFPSVSFLKIDQVPEDKKTQISNNLRLLTNLNGQRGADLRKLIFQTNTPSANFLRELYRWSESLETDQQITWSGIISETMPAFLARVIMYPKKLYQQMLFFRKYTDTKEEDYEAKLLTETTRSLNMLSDKQKWDDITEEMISSNSPQLSTQALIREIGFIPEEILNNKKSADFSPEYILKVIEELRDLENTEIAHIASHEKYKLINFLLTSQIANKIRRADEKNISLDTNGIYINLQGFQAHLPYGLISTECLLSLKQGNWLNDSELLEANIRSHEANTNISAFHFEQEDQLDAFSSSLGIGQNNKSEIINALADQMTANPEKFARSLMNQHLIIPDIFIRDILQSGDKDKIFALFRTAETIGMIITKKDIFPNTDAPNTRKPISNTNEAYKTRADILGDPLYYNTLKITREFLNSKITSDVEERFLVLRGQYKKSARNSQQSFIEILYADKLARVLIDEKKHIGTDRSQKLEHIELFDKTQHENLENALQEFGYFISTIDRLQKILSRRSENWQQKFIRLAETALHFVLNNVASFHQMASQILEIIKYGKNVPDGAYVEILDLFNDAKNQYENFIYNNLNNVANFTEKFPPEIKTIVVQFGSHFADEAESNIAPKNYDLSLSRQEFEIKLCIVNHRSKNSNEAIPHHIEESALNALRIDRNRPLINVIGGSAHNDSADNQLEKFSSTVMKTAHEKKANVAVPGTQSGIGISFGQRNVDYKRQFSHLPYSEQAHLFAVNPGGNTFFPGNKFLRNTNKKDIFANTAVDSIISPFNTNWSTSKGLDKLKSLYLNHVAYKGAFYDRMAINQPKIMVVGNGGLFSIIEIVELLKRDFSLVLVKGTGRFGDAAALLMENIDNIDLTSDQKNKSLIELVRKLAPEIVGEFLDQDFGKTNDTDNEEHLVFREFFWRFVKIAKLKRDCIKTTSLENLSQTLTELI